MFQLVKYKHMVNKTTMSRIVTITSINSNDIEKIEFAITQHLSTFKCLMFAMLPHIARITESSINSGNLQCYQFSDRGVVIGIDSCCGRFGEKYSCVSNVPLRLPETTLYLKYGDTRRGEITKTILIKFSMRYERPETYKFEFLLNKKPYAIEFPSLELLNKLVVNKQILYKYDPSREKRFKTPLGYYYILMYNNEKQTWEAGWAVEKELPPDPEEPSITKIKISIVTVNEEFTYENHGVECLHYSTYQFWMFRDDERQRFAEMTV